MLDRADAGGLGEAGGATGGAVGRVAVATERLSADRAERLCDLIGPAGASFAEGDPLPPLAHWLHFHAREPYAERGPDGHAARGAFLPALPDLARRMWAGGEVEFHAPLRAGAPAQRRSTVLSVARKAGRSGPLAFVGVRHVVEPAGGGAPLLTETQTLVYRPAARAGAAEERPVPSEPVEPTRTRTLTPDPVMLFRYSALTRNGHRIHYDHPYATEVEGYPGLLVHGPLIATLLLDHARAVRPGARVLRFAFRALRPLFADRPLSLHAGAAEGAEVPVWATAPDGGTAMRATAVLAEDAA